jgi:hypothetical protein
MPLVNSGSKKALQKNIEIEIAANPGKENMKKNMAIAYSIQRKNKAKKMARGGEVAEPANKESMADADMSQEESEEMLQGRKASMMPPMKAASMRPDADEKEARSMDMLRKYANGGMVKRAGDIRPTEDEREDTGLGMLEDEESHEDRPSRAASGRPDEDESPVRGRRMLMNPAKREMAPRAAMNRPEVDDSPDYGDDMLSQEEQEDSYSKDGIVRYAKGGIVDKIMQKRKMMAEGGDVADLQNNEDEQPNEEDDMAYDVLRKKAFDLDQISEQPEDSNEHGDDIDSDAHDRVDMIRKKMKRMGR